MVAVSPEAATFNSTEGAPLKKTILALAVLAFAGAAVATSTPPPVHVGTVSVVGTGNNTVQSSSAAGSYVLGAGSSKSTATNTQSATAYVGGTGGATSKPGNAFVTIEDCAPAVKVSGTQLTGSVTSFGGTSAAGVSKASNISTGTGTGGAQAAGTSYAEVAGKTTLVSPNMNLSAEGTAFSFVGTNTGVVGTNGSGTSNGATSSAYKSTANGSLFTYNANGVAGDVKSVTTNTFTRVGGVPTVTTNCGTSTCVTGPSVVHNAVVEGGATSNANGTVTAVIATKP